MAYRLIDDKQERYLIIPQMEERGFHFFGTRGFPARKEGIEDRLVSVRQVHRDDVLIIKEQIEDMAAFMRVNSNKGYDAIVTDQTDIILGIYTADCLPIFLSDPNKGIIAAIHAGWRGAISGIAIKGVDSMTQIFNSSPYNISAGLGPCIGQCCYEVGEDVIILLKERYSYWNDLIIEKRKGRWMLDLLGLNKRELLGCGIPEENIYMVDLCTSCNPSLFFSYRGEGRDTGRMLNGIMLL